MAVKDPSSKPVAPGNDEQSARGLLQLADDLLDGGKKEAAQKRYDEIIKRFPRTKAASVAKEKLESLKK